ncbi:glycosyltransferase [Bacillus sp. NPDC094106]|uniref:glycosyltransferase n=1 Tax=Bacillus sp. NPDC094106 TaxID=3363949 RepID=UPI003804D9E0
MKKVLIVTTISTTVTAFLIPHIKLLENMGFQVEIATKIIGDERKFRSILKGYEVYNLPFSRSVKSLENVKAYKQMKKLISETDYNFIHVHTPIASFLTRLASKKNTKVIYTAHGFHFNENGSFVTNTVFKLAEKIGALKTDKLIVINKDDYKSGGEIISPTKLRYIKGVGVDMHQYNLQVIDLEAKLKLKKELGIKEDSKIITHIAEFNDNKRQLDIVLAAKELIKKYGDKFVVLLVGTGKMLGDIKNKIKELGLDHNVKCLGFRNDVNQILSITNVGLLVSLREGLPKSVMEMMAMKVPVVLTNIRGNRDLVENSKNGFLVDVKSPQQIAECCYSILTNSKLAENFKESSYKKMLEEYSLEKILHELKQVYSDMQ